MQRANYEWDYRSGKNVDHVADHDGITPEEWQIVYESAYAPYQDKDDADVWLADGRLGHERYRVVYRIKDNSVIPITVTPITIYPADRRGRRPE